MGAKKVGNKTFEILRLDLYDYDQCTSSSLNKSFKLKEGQIGKTQKVIIFLVDTNGKLFTGSFTKKDIEQMNDEDLKFKDFIISSFKINN